MCGQHGLFSVGVGIERVDKRYMSAYQSTITSWRSLNLEGNCKFPTNTADAYWRNATDSYSIRYTCESWHLKCVGNMDCSVGGGRERLDIRGIRVHINQLYGVGGH